MVNSSSLSDFQCYNESYDFTSSDICTYFRECNDIPVMLSLTPADENCSVSLTEGRLEMVFKVPVHCSCSAATSSSSLGDAEIAAVTLGVLVAVALTTTFVVVIFFYRERRKKS